MDFRGYGGGPPRQDFPPHLQEQNSMMQGGYGDPRSFSQHRSPEYDFPPGHGPPFWHHDAPSRPEGPPQAYPPSFPSYNHPQYESGYFRPPPPPESSQFSPFFAPQSASFGETGQYPARGSPHSSSFGENAQYARSFGDNAQYSRQFTPPSSTESPQYPPYSISRSSSSGEHAQPEIHSVSEHRDYYRGYSFEDQARSASVHSRDLQRSSAEEEMLPAILQREFVLGNEALSSADAELPKGQLVRVFCKYDRNFNLAVEDNRVVMMEANAEDELQQWIRDDRYSVRVRDNYGHPAFILINKGSKKALKHGPGQLEEVQLTNYIPGVQDDNLFWTESQDLTEGFRTVRKASDTLLNLSVSCGNNIENGCLLILDTWHKRDNQLWKIFPM